MTKFYIADMHFGHENIIRFDGRPYNTVAEMNEALINNWNNRVTNRDEVFVLGDMFFKASNEEIHMILKKLNGIKHLIEGNHDSLNDELKTYFRSVSQIKEVKDTGRKIVLCHYPIMNWNGNINAENLHFYGHVHSTFEYSEVLQQNALIHMNRGTINRGRMYNIGAMMPWMDYTPRTLAEIINGN